MEEVGSQIDDESPERLAAILRESFRDEAYELVAALEGALLELEKTPEDAELIGTVFRALHTIKGSSAACGLTDISSFSHEVETPFDLVRKGKLAVAKDIIDLALSACDHIRTMFDVCYRGGTSREGGQEDIVAAFRRLRAQEDEPPTALSAACAGEGSGNNVDMPRNPGDRHHVLESGDTLVGGGTASRQRPEAASAAHQLQSDGREKRDQAQMSSIHVSVEKLDRLIDLVGELVTVQTRLSRIAFTNGNSALSGVAEEVERITTELRDSTMSVRMLPFGTIFGKFRRLVRDLSEDLGKNAELVTEGAETELDKTVIERLTDPLIHLIRNSVDHGIEKPEIRTAAGKRQTGTISLSAVHAGAHVLIEIRDDGAGLDTAAIRSKALEKGLISKKAELSDQELFSLVLTPGFSTATSVTDVSGRGVGLDVVKRTIDALRGSIEINSSLGTGTSITLRLPLTLAIIEGFLTQIGTEHFIFPLSLVEECRELTREQADESHGRNLITVRNHLVPYIRLRELFHTNGELPSVEQVVITVLDDKRVGFVVDHIVGEYQTVIKNLGKVYRDVDGISGATILGDGTVALILDVPNLLQAAITNERRRTEHADSSCRCRH